VRIEWSPVARASAQRCLEDQDGMHQIGTAVAALAADPYPLEAFQRGEYHRPQVRRRAGSPVNRPPGNSWASPCPIRARRPVGSGALALRSHLLIAARLLRRSTAAAVCNILHMVGEVSTM
jgi:hypothetical protein